jgi:hypothetical protein
MYNALDMPAGRERKVSSNSLKCCDKHLLSKEQEEEEEWHLGREEV